MTATVRTLDQLPPYLTYTLHRAYQRRVGKAIRRAKMMGIIPVLSRRTLLHEGKR